jgi:hypothetical protein
VFFYALLENGKLRVTGGRKATGPECQGSRATESNSAFNNKPDCFRVSDPVFYLQRFLKEEDCMRIGEVKLEKLFSVIAGTGLALLLSCTVYAQSNNTNSTGPVGPYTSDIHQNRQNIHQDWSKIKADRSDIAKDRQAISSDRQDLRTDRKNISNDYSDIQKERQDMRANPNDKAQDESQIKKDYGDISKNRQAMHTDRKDIRQNKQTIHNDKRDIRQNHANIHQDRRNIHKDRVARRQHIRGENHGTQTGKPGTKPAAAPASN